MYPFSGLRDRILNVNKYKCPCRGVVNVGHGEVVINPISQHEISAAYEQTDYNLKDIARQNQQLYDIELKTEILSRATSERKDSLLGLGYNQLSFIFNNWIELQNRSTPDIEKLAKHCKWGVVKDSEILEDGSLANSCKTIVDFYGKPVSKLTNGQLAYYICVKNAFYEMHIENEDKKYTQAWLERHRQYD